MARSPAWQRKEGKSKSGGLNRKGIASYRAANPGSKLSMAVTTKPSKLKKGSKAANRRKSFCARMSGMKKKMIKEYGGKEKYKSKAAMKKHEKKESKKMEAREKYKMGGRSKKGKC